MQAREELYSMESQFAGVAEDLQRRLDEKEVRAGRNGRRGGGGSSGVAWVCSACGSSKGSDRACLVLAVAQAKAQEIYESFVEFKREIAKVAENSRTGKPIPRRIIKQFELTEAAKDKDVEKVRLKNIHVRAQLRKLEARLKDKEQLADGLHLIDFEQLKIENQTLNEKIEERNEELHKLRKKTTTTVQVLTHIKEKLQFVQADVGSFKGALETLEGDCARERDGLNHAKRVREEVRVGNERCVRTRGCGVGRGGQRRRWCGRQGACAAGLRELDAACGGLRGPVAAH